MHPSNMPSGRATAGRAGGYKLRIFHAFSCAFMHFFGTVKNKVSSKSAIDEKRSQKAA
jgi:hypothetical protein